MQIELSKILKILKIFCTEKVCL